MIRYEYADACGRVIVLEAPWDDKSGTEAPTTIYVTVPLGANRVQHPFVYMGREKG